MNPRALQAAALLFVLAAASPSMALAQAADSLAGPRDAMSDSASRALVQAPDSLGGYLEAMSDSTDRYFGSSAIPADTTGFDSTLAARLDNPFYAPRRPRFPVERAPWIAFSRVDGSTTGLLLGVGDERALGQLGGRLGYAAGPRRWRGEGTYGKRWERRGEDGPRWTLRFSAGRLTRTLDQDHDVPWVRWAAAFLSGNDRQHYLRRDGGRVSLELGTPLARVQAAFRSELESPLVTTVTWSLFRKPIELTDNRPAARGRAREILLAGGAHLPFLPLRAEGELALGGLGGDFDYRRLRVALGGDWALRHTLALVPQFEYGRLTGDLLPQASFFLGGRFSLRSLEEEALGGTSKAVARLDCILTPDLLGLLGLPHSTSFPIQAGAFAGTGAVQGLDPLGGPGTAERAWPERAAWRSEAGCSLLYRPGLPDPEGFLRLDYALPLGPGHDGRLSLYFSRPMGLLRPL